MIRLWGKWCWIGFCGSLVAFFGGAAIAFAMSAFHFLLHPPWWEIALSKDADPNVRALTRGDFSLQLMLACAPAGFCLLWIGRLIKSLKDGGKP
jgi:hypothetical protein